MSSANPFYHVAILVSDLDEAIAHYGALYGLTFSAAVDIVARATQRGGSDAPMPCRLAYSRQGPMHVELFQAHGEGLWSATRALGVHHIGLWCIDPKACADEMVAKGCAWEASLYFGESSPGIVFVRDRGVLIELVAEGLRPSFEALLQA